MRTINETIVHCTATPEGRPHTVKDIDAWHRARGWSGVGYHRVVGLDGERWQGRADAAIGAHVEGRNTGTLGLVYVGGVAKDGKTAKDTRTAAQKIALEEELHDHIQRFRISKISGHNEYAARACPSFAVPPLYGGLLKSPGEHQPIVDRVLQRGDFGPPVRDWRAQLDAYRVKVGHTYRVPEGDVFDHTIELVTIWFQKERGILADGKVGPQTRSEMELALADRPPFQARPEWNDDPDVIEAARLIRAGLAKLGA